MFSFYLDVLVKESESDLQSRQQRTPPRVAFLSAAAAEHAINYAAATCYHGRASPPALAERAMSRRRYYLWRVCRCRAGLVHVERDGLLGRPAAELADERLLLRGLDGVGRGRRRLADRANAT